MFQKFTMKETISYANLYQEGAAPMNIETHSESRSEISATPEPWHRGSTFTWLLLGLAGLVFFLTANS